MELIRDNWTKNDYDDFVEELRSYADEKYRSFHSSLIPDNDKGFFIGVRMPVMRKLGKEISKGNGRSFLEQTTDNSYEEKTMRGIVIGLLKTESYEEFLMYSDDFVQRIDSWAVCDGFCANLIRIFPSCLRIHKKRQSVDNSCRSCADARLLS